MDGGEDSEKTKEVAKRTEWEKEGPCWLCEGVIRVYWVLVPSFQFGGQK